MEQHPLNESLWRRGWNDTKVSFHQLRFFWGVEVGVMGAFGYLADVGYLIPNWHPAIWTAIGAGIGYLGIFALNLIRAPYRQRDEARELVEQLKMPSGIEVNNIIQLLEAEKLVLKSEEGERSYSFSQVFLAIADHLSVGVLFGHLESSIKKGLSIDIDKGEWYFPYEDKGITHLIGVLAQNGLVDRCSEKYQRMTRDYPQDIDDIIRDLLLKKSGMNIFNTKPPQHLEEGTEVKYYLSLPLGARVVKQLRQQSTAHKEGSRTE